MAIELKILESFIKSYDVKKVATVEGSKEGKGSLENLGFPDEVMQVILECEGGLMIF